MSRVDGWSPWALSLLILSALALTALGASVAYQAKQYGTLLLGLIGAGAGVLFLINAPGWSRRGQD